MARSKTQRKAAARAPLTRERVLRAGVTFADARGVEALSMRALARELGFGVMSLYNHVASRNDLLDGMVDLVATEIEAPVSPTGDWKKAMRQTAQSAHQVLMRHAWASTMWSHRGPGPAKLRHMDAILKCLREEGFTVDVACRGFHAITLHIVGSTLGKLDFPFEPEELPALASNFLERMPTEEYPYFAEHVMHHIEATEHPGSFEFVLDLILDGIDRAGGARDPA